MQAVLPAAVKPRRARTAENAKKFANDGSLESVEQLLYKLAIKCHARVQAMGLGMDFEDVLQEMRLSYVKARRSWKPDGGSLFVTYCQTACLNNFNNAIEKMERERRELGMVSVDDLVSDTEDGNGTDDPFEVLMNQEAGAMDAPEARIERLGEMRRNIASLSPGARRLIAHLLGNQKRAREDGTIVEDAKLRDLARCAGLQGAELTRVKAEILQKFGVAWV